MTTIKKVKKQVKYVEYQKDFLNKKRFNNEKTLNLLNRHLGTSIVMSYDELLKGPRQFKALIVDKIFATVESPF